MDITKEDVEEFQRTWHEDLEEEIGEDEARAQIARLDELYLLLASARTRACKDVGS